MNTRTKSKTIRFPEALCNQLTAEAKQSGNSFTAVVIDRLTQSNPVVIVESSKLAQALFAISTKLNELSSDSDAIALVSPAVDQVVELVLEIREKYLAGGDDHGNPEGR